MSTDDTRVYRGDGCHLIAEWSRLDAICAEVKLVRERDRKTILDGEFAEVDGNITVYPIAPIHLAIDGVYTAYLTATFIDGVSETKKRTLTVVPKR